MTNEDLRNRITFIKDVFEISKTTILLRDQGYLEPPDAHEMAIQTAQLGMTMWKKAWKDLSSSEKISTAIDDFKIDRGDPAVVK